jgi:hypothetical protein
MDRSPSVKIFTVVKELSVSSSAPVLAPAGLSSGGLAKETSWLYRRLAKPFGWLSSYIKLQTSRHYDIRTDWEEG